MSQVSDYDIANASGASVRSDLNAVFDAIKTLNSGSNDPSNTSAFMPYVDTADSNKLKIRNASNNGFTTVGSVDEANLGLLPKAGGAMEGQLLGNNGLGSGSPAFAFNGNTNTGMFRPNSNTIGFSTAGLERATIASTGLTINDQKELRLNEQASNGTSFVGLKSPASLSGNRQFTLPDTTGSVGQLLSIKNANHSTTNAELEFVNQIGGTNGVSFNNSIKAQFGTGNLLEIQHNGTNAVIGNNFGDIYIENDSNAIGEKIFIRPKATLNSIECIANGAVKLYHHTDSNTAKLETISTGLKCNGNLESTASVIAGNVQATGAFFSGTAGKAPPFVDGNATQIGQLVKSWVLFNGTGTISVLNSFNVSSLTDHGVGDYSVNFANTIKDHAGNATANICCSFAISGTVFTAPGQLAHTHAFISSRDQFHVRFLCHKTENSGQKSDQPYAAVQVFG